MEETTCPNCGSVDLEIAGGDEDNDRVLMECLECGHHFWADPQDLL